MEKKLLYILNHYSENSVQHFYHVINLLERMADKNVKIVLVIEKCQGKPEINNSNIKVVAQKETNKYKRVLELKKILKYYIGLGYKKIFVRISTNAAIIAIGEAKRRGAEVYYWQSGETLTLDLKRKGLDKIKYLLLSYSKLLYIKNNVDYFVTGPEKMIQYYTEVLKVKKEKMMLLYNDIDTSRFQKCSEDEKCQLKKELGIIEGKTVIMFAHRFSPVRKTYLWLPYVMEDRGFRDNQVLFLIIGGGPDYEKVKEQIEKSEYNDLAKVVGSVPNKEIMNYYKIADIFINPSYTEGFPRVVIEAMASGLPVVATNAGGTCDIVGKEQRNYIVDKDDKEQFRNILLDLVQNKDIRERLSKENLEYVKKYSTENVADMYIEKIFS